MINGAMMSGRQIPTVASQLAAQAWFARIILGNLGLEKPSAFPQSHEPNITQRPNG